MEMEVQKKEEVINTLLDRIDGDDFTFWLDSCVSADYNIFES